MNNGNSTSTQPPKTVKPASDIMKSRIESFINHGEEDAELASQYLDKKEQIKQQRLGPKSSIGMFSIFEYHLTLSFNSMCKISIAQYP